jgi:hypothetical protein
MVSSEGLIWTFVGCAAIASLLSVNRVYRLSVSHYVKPFPTVSGNRWLISTDGGAAPRWSPDGHVRFYVEPSGALSAVRIRERQVVQQWCACEARCQE